MNIDDLKRQILHNCMISDARHAGHYSICGLALRLRDLYKWEHHLPPWREPRSEEILEWIGVREEMWTTMESMDFEAIRIDGARLDPFDADGVNAALAPLGFVYGAGYAYWLKPTFFLAEVAETFRVDGASVVVTGPELARDLLTIPAFSQEGRVLIRGEAARLFIWDQIMYLKKSGRPALRYALARCGIGDACLATLKHRLDDIFAVQRDSYAYHELGEIRDTVFDREIWRALVNEHAYTIVELLARTLKDLLADLGPAGLLPNIIRERNDATLGFHVAFFDGLGREIFPELRPAFQLFAADPDWDIISEAVHIARDRTRRLTEDLCHLHQDAPAESSSDWLVTAVNRRFEKYLGRSGDSMPNDGTV